jgi:RNA polymerase sigma-70 factor (ECF subfamily)
LASLIDEEVKSVTGFDEIFRAYFSDVLLYIKKLSGSESIAEEITSDTFFKVMRSLDSFRGDCDLRVWLCQIAKNSYYSYLRKNSRLADTADIESLDVSDETQSVEDYFLSQSEAMRAHIFLHDLSEPYKEVFMLRVFSELSFAQIGKIFGKSQNWACVTYHRAKAKIREQMEGKPHES